MSKRQDIITALEARLQTITIANGYNTDAGGRVFVWRTAQVEPAEAPCLLVEDTKLKRKYDTVMGQVHNRLHCAVLAVMVGQDDEAARVLEADIIKCLGTWQTAGGLADRLLVVESDIAMEPHGKIIGAALSAVEVEYYTSESQC